MLLQNAELQKQAQKPSNKIYLKEKKLLSSRRHRSVPCSCIRKDNYLQQALLFVQRGGHAKYVKFHFLLSSASQRANQSVWTEIKTFLPSSLPILNSRILLTVYLEYNTLGRCSDAPLWPMETMTLNCSDLRLASVALFNFPHSKTKQIWYLFLSQRCTLSWDLPSVGTLSTQSSKCSKEPRRVLKSSTAERGLNQNSSSL